MARGLLPTVLFAVAARKLDAIDAATSIDQLRIPPSIRLEALKGDRAGQHSIRINEEYRICFTCSGTKPPMSRSWTTTEPVVLTVYKTSHQGVPTMSALLVPTHRRPTTPGEMLLEEFLKPLKISQTDFAKQIRVSQPRLNEIIKGKRTVTPDTAMRLERALGMKAQFWLNLQMIVDLYEAQHSGAAKDIKKIKKIRMPTAA